MWNVIFILSLHLIFGTTDLISGPRNTVVTVGQRMEMKCQAHNDSIIREWSMQRMFTSKKDIIFTNWKERIEIRNLHFGIVYDRNSSVALYTNSTEMNDAGIYSCYVQKLGRQRDRYSAHLIVFETEPLCETNLSYSENNIFADGAGGWMRCSVNFNGNWAPTLEWRLHEGNGETEEPIDHTDRANVVTISSANISSSLTIILNSTSKSFFYSCKVYFTSENNSQMVTANNTPDYKYEWKSPLVLSLPKTGIGLSPTQWKVVLLSKTVTSPTQWRGLTTATDTNESRFLAPTVNALHLVVGAALLFGITSSIITIVVCLRHRGRTSASMAQTNPGAMEASEYDMIHQIHTDGYETIEEVDEAYEILFLDFPQQHGSLPSPGYSGLMPEEPKPPGVYSRMDRTDNSVDDRKSDVNGNGSQSEDN